jgi:hypothetical protein
MVASTHRSIGSTRRDFLGQLCVLPAAPLLGLGAASPEPSSRSTAELLADLDQLSHRLASGQIEPDAWQRGAEGLFASSSAPDLLAAIGLDWSALRQSIRRSGQVAHRLAPTELDVCPPSPAFRAKLFGFSRDHAILPHAHHNLVSVFFVLAGRFRGRHFDRVREEPEAILIRPSGDRILEPGDAAAISDHRDNVHWFTALDDQSLLFNLGVTIPEPLRDPRERTTGRIYLDPDGEPLEGGLLRAPRASLSQLRAKYEG